MQLLKLWQMAKLVLKQSAKAHGPLVLCMSPPTVDIIHVSIELGYYFTSAWGHFDIIMCKLSIKSTFIIHIPFCFVKSAMKFRSGNPCSHATCCYGCQNEANNLLLNFCF